MRRMKHESVAKDLVRQATKLVAKPNKAKEIEVTLNSVSHYIRLNGSMVEFWSAEKCCEFPTTATEAEMYAILLDELNKTMSRKWPIEYIV